MLWIYIYMCMKMSVPSFAFIHMLAIHVDHWREDEAVEYGCAYRQTHGQHASQQQAHRLGQGHARSLQQSISDWFVIDQIEVTADCV